jgi:hypothetical protein
MYKKLQKLKNIAENCKKERKKKPSPMYGRE